MKSKQTFPAAIQFATDTVATKSQAFNMTIRAPPCDPLLHVKVYNFFAPALGNVVYNLKLFSSYLDYT
jgi:hypothetical protein